MSKPASHTGRPQRQPNVEGGRGHRYVVKVNDEESSALETEAKAQGVTVARLMVEMALAREAGSDSQMASLTVTEKRDLVTALWSLKTAIGGVAVNINQVARYANATQTFPAEANELLLVGREVLVRVEEFIAEFYPQSKLAEARKDVAARTIWLDKGWASHIAANPQSGQREPTDVTQPTEAEQ